MKDRSYIQIEAGYYEGGHVIYRENNTDDWTIDQVLEMFKKFLQLKGYVIGYEDEVILVRKDDYDYKGCKNIHEPEDNGGHGSIT